jgi:hypothetical protein
LFVSDVAFAVAVTIAFGGVVISGVADTIAGAGVAFVAGSVFVFVAVAFGFGGAVIFAYAGARAPSLLMESSRGLP